MASMLGHVLGAQATLGLASRMGPAALASRRAMWLAGAVAVIPDLDNPLAILLGDPEHPGWLQHRGPSHSLLVFGVLAAAAATLCIWGALKPVDNPVWSWFRAFLAFAFVGGAHVALDWLMGRGTLLKSPPEMGLLWPFSDHTCANSPVQLIPTAFYSTGSWGSFLGVLKDWQTWVGVLLELVIFVPLVLLAWGKAAGKLRWAMAGLSAAGMLVTYILYQAARAI
jgi:membrane-bound metal-dependent hydrolase YbcI (DUF457 family)